MLLRRGRLIQKALSNEELLIVLIQQINFDRHQKAAAIDYLGTSVLDLKNICNVYHAPFPFVQ
jgi:hypothetical protein